MIVRNNHKVFKRLFLFVRSKSVHVCGCVNIFVVVISEYLNVVACAGALIFMTHPNSSPQPPSGSGLVRDITVYICLLFACGPEFLRTKQWTVLSEHVYKQ